jgi:predicted DNA-binding protein YlxM (UPF0122 family)
MSTATTDQTDLEFPQLWDNYAHLLQQRQRMLQSAMAYYLQADASVKALYENEEKSGIPSFDHSPETTGGKNALNRFNSVVSSYLAVKKRFKETFDL